MKRARCCGSGEGLLALLVAPFISGRAGRIRAAHCRAAGLPADDADHARDERQ